MEFKKGAMVYGENLDIEFIGIISDVLPDGRYKLDSAIMRETEWVNLSDPIYERQSSIIEIVDVDLFDLFYDIKKQPSITLNEFLQMVAGTGSAVV
jgi:hypothetical protein